MHLIKFVSVLLVAAASAFAAESFEGKITMRITSDGKSHDLAYAIKGSRMRMEMAADGKTMSTILDMKAKEMMMLMPEEKSDFGPMGGKRKPAAWEAELRSKGFFPLRTVMKGRKGREDKMEVVNVEKTSLPDSFFAPPAGYKKFEMPGMGGLLQGLGGKN